MSLIKIILALFILLSTLNASQKPTLIFYCGITMVKPIKEMAKIIEEKFNCKIKISQGGSKDLYDSLKYSKIGDLYLPGSIAYIKNSLDDGFIKEYKKIGYNQAAIFVHKGNPKNIKSLEEFIDKKFSSIICDPSSSSIGKMSKKIFLKYKGKEFYENIYDNSVEIGTDSRNLNKALIEKRADLTINWKATASWQENKKHIDVINIDKKLAPKKELALALLSFSKNEKIAKAFINLASSKQGQEIMKKYGFL